MYSFTLLLRIYLNLTIQPEIFLSQLSAFPHFSFYHPFRNTCSSITDVKLLHLITLYFTSIIKNITYFFLVFFSSKYTILLFTGSYKIFMPLIFIVLLLFFILKCVHLCYKLQCKTIFKRVFLYLFGRENHF